MQGRYAEGWWDEVCVETFPFGDMNSKHARGWDPLTYTKPLDTEKQFLGYLQWLSFKNIAPFIVSEHWEFLNIELSENEDKTSHSLVLTRRQAAKQSPLPDAAYFSSFISYHLLLYTQWLM